MTCIQRRESVKEKNKHPTILKIPDELWDEIKKVLPEEKSSNKTIGRPNVPYRKVLDGILYILRTEDANGKCYLKNMVQVQHVIDDFKNGMA